MTLNWVDVLILLIVTIGTYSSLRTGLLRQALSLIGFVVAIYAALTHHTTVATVFESAIGSGTAAGIVAFVLILMVVWWAFAVLAAMARKALKAAGLVWTDHFMGAVVGLLAGLFFTVCFLLLFVRVAALGISDAIGESYVASLIFRVLPHLRRLLPADLQIFTVI
ncbi:MAG: CvpA family protein [Anaerolineales bacterium]|nr:MAG: CvpA family protein [Anaerolineales bacterium]